MYQGAERTIPDEKQIIDTIKQQFVDTARYVAITYETKGEYAKSILLREEIYKLISDIHGKDHWKSVDAKLVIENTKVIQKLTKDELLLLQKNNQLARTLLKQGKYQDAIQYKQKEYDTFQKIYGPNSLSAITSQNDLAVCYLEYGNVKEGLNVLNLVTNKAKTTLGENHPDRAQFLNNMAVALSKNSQFTLALDYHDQAMEIRKNTLGTASLAYAESLHNKATTLDHLARFEEALSLHQKSIDIYRQLKNEAGLAACLEGLGTHFLERGDFTKSDYYYKQVLKYRKAVLGETHPDYATTLNNLSVLHEQIGDLKNAIIFNKQAIEIQKVSRGAHSIIFCGRPSLVPILPVIIVGKMSGGCC